MPALSLNEYQEKAARTALYPGSDDTTSILGLAYTTMGLSGEAGEIANKTKKIIRDDFSIITGMHRVKLASELGDVLWYAALLAKQLGYPLEVVAQWNLAKLERREEDGTLQGSGDNR